MVLSTPLPRGEHLQGHAWVSLYLAPFTQGRGTECCIGGRPCPSHPGPPLWVLPLPWPASVCTQCPHQVSAQRGQWQQKKLLKEMSGSSQSPRDEAQDWPLIMMLMGFGPQGCPKLPGVGESGVGGQTTGQRGTEATAVLGFPGTGQQGGVNTTLAGFSDLSGLWSVLRCQAPGRVDLGRGVSLPGAGQVAEAGPPQGVGTGHRQLLGPWQVVGGVSAHQVGFQLSEYHRRQKTLNGYSPPIPMGLQACIPRSDSGDGYQPLGHVTQAPLLLPS